VIFAFNNIGLLLSSFNDAARDMMELPPVYFCSLRNWNLAETFSWSRRSSGWTGR
jgi:hypothetical protein